MFIKFSDYKVFGSVVLTVPTFSGFLYMFCTLISTRWYFRIELMLYVLQFAIQLTEFSFAMKFLSEICKPETFE